MNTDHSGWRHGLFYLALSLLVCHELDGVGRHEWRLLPFMGGVDDQTAGAIFILAHVPVFAVLFWATAHRSDAVRSVSQLVVDAFLIAHAGVHILRSGAEVYEFAPPVSTITIHGGAVVGFLHLAWTLAARSRARPPAT